MAKILEFKGKIPRWVFEEFVIYLLDGEWIIREKTGFTRKELLTAAKYVNCRKNASEFGRLSKACKGLRMALEGILPKKNNLGIVNSLTKHMRSLLAYDTKHIRGERQLASALEHSEGLRMFTGYNFNPDATQQVRTNVVDGRLAVSNVTKTEGVSWVGFRVHVMDYDWELFSGEMHSGNWHFERDVTDGLLLELPEIIGGGDLIYLLEVQGFEERDGEFVGVGVDEKGVFVVDYLPCLPAKLHFEEARGCHDVSLSRSVGTETTRNDSAIERRDWNGVLKQVHDDNRDHSKSVWLGTRGCYRLSLSGSEGFESPRAELYLRNGAFCVCEQAWKEFCFASSLTLESISSATFFGMTNSASFASSFGMTEWLVAGLCRGVSLSRSDGFERIRRNNLGRKRRRQTCCPLRIEFVAELKPEVLHAKDPPYFKSVNHLN